MRLPCLALTALLVLAFFAPLAATRAQSDPAETSRTAIAVLERVLVTGEQPGPGLWKVTKDGNVLWILATFGPLPDKMVWRSRQVEAVIQESQEIYSESSFNMHFSNDRKAGKRLQDALKNVDGKTLKDALPPDLYQQFSALNHRFAGDSKNFESFRPFYATQELKNQALRNVQLASDGRIGKTIRRLAKKHHVKFRSLMHEDNRFVYEVIAGLNALPREADLECAKMMMDRLEPDIKQAVARANAWVTGDIATLRQDSGLTERRTNACLDLLSFSQHVVQVGLESRKLGDAALRDALKTNRSTLAMVPITELFDLEGILARFRADGFVVEEP